MIDFAAIKARHRIEDVLAKRGAVLHKVSGGWATRCLIHDGKKPRSLFIHEKKQYATCWTQCGHIGSVIDVVMALDGAADAVAAVEILEGRQLTATERDSPRPARAERLRLVADRQSQELPKFFRGEKRHFEQVGLARGLPWQTIQLAHDFGHLRFCQAGWRAGQKFNCYAVMDIGNPVNVQFRRMDADPETLKALPFWDDVKVMGWRGNNGRWPVGLDSAIQHLEADILLVEGTGDFLAAWWARQCGHEVIPVAMFGSSNPIDSRAMPFFERRRVIIAQQHDESGKKAAEKWASALSAVPARVSIWPVPGDGFDLNDYISAGGDVGEIFECG